MNTSLSKRVDDQLRRGLVAWTSRGKPKSQSVSGVRLSDEPTVFAMWDYIFDNKSKAQPEFWDRWRGKPLLVILLRTWEIATLEQVEPWSRVIAEHRRRHPLHRIVYAANAPVELPVLEAARIEAIWCSHNALVNERIFVPLPGASAGDERKFDAVYDGRLGRCKRHHLAVRVERLALIYYMTPGLCEPLWLMATRWRLRHAKLINRHRWGCWPKWMGSQQVAATYNRARVGLCLSAVEGAMLASIQYLLCGLPVVTTPSRGGRDVFFDAENSIEVPPDSRAVAEGVRTMIERKVDPWTIRARALERMGEHRARLIAFVDEFQREHGVPVERRLSSEAAARLGSSFKDRLDL